MIFVAVREDFDRRGKKQGGNDDNRRYGTMDTIHGNTPKA
jgi:hypothetical protein